MDFIIIYLLIIIHELGHILTANLLHIKLQKIYIEPPGGISKLNRHINFSQVKELIIFLELRKSQYIRFLLIELQQFLFLTCQVLHIEYLGS